MENGTDFFTVQSMATFGGLTAAVTIVGNAFRSLTNGKDPKIVAFITSLVFCFLIASVEVQTTFGYAIAVVNGCLVYLTAMGFNNQVYKIPKKNRKTSVRNKSSETREPAEVLESESKVRRNVREPIKSESTMTSLVNFFEPW